MIDNIPMQRDGDWMQTATGRQFWPLDPRPSEICIEDIAHSLSMMCRYGGHCLRFYSVAEHSVLMSRAVSRENALWALLHDASEAYVVDVPRPLKANLPNYKNLESHVMGAVCIRFGISHVMPAEVKSADNQILLDESTQNMGPSPAPWGIDGEPLGVVLQFWSPEQAKAEFVKEFAALTDAGAA